VPPSDPSSEKEEAQMTAIGSAKAIAASMLDEALEFCAGKTGLTGKDEARKALGNGDCSVCEYMRHALARRMAEYLGSMDDTIQAIYTYEPEYATSGDEPIPGRPNLSPGLSLIALVSSKSAALSSMVASLSAALVEETRQLRCPKANALCQEIVFGVANTEEVQKRTGYGALIDSIYVRPMEVWRR
jgi:hypothetical protein